MSATQNRWLPHLACLGLLVAQCAVWGLNHRTADELESAASSGDTATRIAALHILTNRGEPAPERFDSSFAQSLVDEQDELLREYAFTTEICKHADPSAQYRYLKQLTEDSSSAHFWRGFVLHRRKIGVVTGGSSARLKLQELDWYFDAAKGRELPGDEIRRYIQANP